jgi:hypothetical protein
MTARFHFIGAMTLALVLGGCASRQELATAALEQTGGGTSPGTGSTPGTAATGSATPESVSSGPCLRSPPRPYGPRPASSKISRCSTDRKISLRASSSIPGAQAPVTGPMEIRVSVSSRTQPPWSASRQLPPDAWLLHAADKSLRRHTLIAPESR